MKVNFLNVLSKDKKNLKSLINEILIKNKVEDFGIKSNGDSVILEIENEITLKKKKY